MIFKSTHTRSQATTANNITISGTLHPVINKRLPNDFFENNNFRRMDSDLKILEKRMKPLIERLDAREVKFPKIAELVRIQFFANVKLGMLL